MRTYFWKKTLAFLSFVLPLENPDKQSFTPPKKLHKIVLHPLKY